MSLTYEALEREARLLTAEEWAQLADALLDSFRGEQMTEITAAWAIEIERRASTYEYGDAKLVASEDVFAKARLISGT